jgi:hydroxymethylbilane synthase
MGATLNIGTRGSKLALWQAEWTRSQLEAHHPGLKIDLVVIKTRGDKILDVPLAKVGGKGLFVKEIEEALLDGRIDLAVHSMKDMPGEIPPGLCIGPIPPREDPRDVLISREGKAFSDLGVGASIGTSSLRRAAQLTHARPDIIIHSLRGNLDTRLKKLETENLDAIVLAAAGVKRLNLEERITQYLEPSLMLPAVAQGALCVEIRQDDTTVQSIVGILDHPETRKVVMGERAYLSHLGGSCQVPVAGHGSISGDRFTLTGLVADLDGSVMLRETHSGPVDDNVLVGIELADRLMKRGGKEILEKLSGADDQ